MAAFLCPFSAKPWSKVSWNHWDYFYRLHGLSCSPECTTKLVLISECRAQWCCCQRAPLAPGDLLLPQQRLQLHSPWPRGPGDAVKHGGLLCSLWNYQLYLALTSHTKVAWNEMSTEPVLHPRPAVPGGTSTHSQWELPLVQLNGQGCRIVHQFFLFADQQLWKWKEIIRTNSTFSLKPSTATGNSNRNDCESIMIFVQGCLICPSLLASSGHFLKWRITSFA